MKCHLFSLDLRSCVQRTSKNCISSVVIETSIWNCHHYAIWMWSEVSMHYIVVRRYQWTFNRSLLYFIESTYHMQQKTGRHCVLYALCLVYGLYVWFCTTCICLVMIRVVRLLPRQRCGLSISLSLFDGTDATVISMGKRCSKDVVRSLNTFDDESLICHWTRNPSVLWRKMVVDWWCGVDNVIKDQHKLFDRVKGKCLVFFFILFDEWWSTLE